MDVHLCLGGLQLGKNEKPRGRTGVIARDNESTSPAAPRQNDLHRLTTSYMDISLPSVLLQKSCDHPKLALELGFSAAC